MFSLVTIPQENRQTGPDCGFQGQRMFIWIPLTGHPVAGVCVCACIYINFSEHVHVCVSVCAEENKVKREEGASLEVCFQHCSVPKARRLKFAVVATSKLCRKIATVRGKPHFPARHNCTNDYKIEQFTGNA